MISGQEKARRAGRANRLGKGYADNLGASVRLSRTKNDRGKMPVSQLSDEMVFAVGSLAFALSGVNQALIQIGDEYAGGVRIEAVRQFWFLSVVKKIERFLELEPVNTKRHLLLERTRPSCLQAMFILNNSWDISEDDGKIVYSSAGYISTQDGSIQRLMTPTDSTRIFQLATDLTAASLELDATIDRSGARH